MPVVNQTSFLSGSQTPASWAWFEGMVRMLGEEPRIS
jgi:hypothetical protein